MKLTVRKWINSSIKIATFVVSFALLASCADDQLLVEDRSQNAEAVKTTPPDQSPILNPFSASAACADNLANDGCNFTSGTGRDHPNQFLMVNMMNNCRTESLPPNCSWNGNITQTRILEVDLNNCCYPFSSFNFVLNGWKTAAANIRPAGGYLITNYQRINGYMVTVYGPYRMVIQVTYRKKGACPIKSDSEIDLPIDFTE